MPYKFNPFTGKLDNAPGAPVFKDDKFRVVDEGDSTKRVALEVSGVSPGVTRVLDVQDVDGPIAVGYGAANQYIRGDATISNFPVAAGGGSSVSYYLNGSVSQGTILGNPYYEINKTAVIGAGTNFSLNAGTNTAYFITDPSDPSLLQVPQGNFNFQLYASTSSGAPTLQVELYKYDGAAFTQIGSTSSAIPITTTTADIYLLTVSAPATTLLVTDRLAVRVIAGSLGGNTITLYTEGDKLGQMITTFSTGMAALNGLSDQIQFISTSTTGTDFTVSSASATHTFNLPVASATNTGKLSSSDWSTFNAKAPGAPQYVVMSADAGLPNERVLTQGTNIAITDGGANNPVTVATVADPVFDLVEFDSTYTSGVSQYQMAWNDTDGTVEIGLKGGNVDLSVGQEEVVLAKNDDTIALNPGTAVYVSGADGTNILVKRAKADADATSVTTIGLVAETLTHPNGKGFITTFGVIKNINTTGSPYGETWTAGDIIYLSPTITGGLTNIKPSAPQHLVQIGFVVKTSAGNGEIFVEVQNGYELEELHDVQINSGTLANNDLLAYNLATQTWQNKTAASSGLVTSVGATAPITSSGGATPTISTSIATNRVVGRSTAGTGAMEELTPVGITVSAGNITGIGGTLGTVDNAVPRADGVGGYTAQGSDIIIDDATTTTQNNIAIRNDHSGQTNSALVLTPKGTGAFILGPKPDGTATGGNARGTNAVDLQTTRGNAARVASGQSSFTAGFDNTASGTYNIALGRQCNASGSQNAAVLGGEVNVASANFSTSAGGQNNTASGVYAGTFAGFRTVADRYSMQSHAAGRFATDGDAQRARFVMRNKTTTNAAVELFLDGSSARLTIPSGKYLTGTINIAGIKSDGTAAASYIRQFSIKNVAGTTSLVGTVNTIGTDEAAGTTISITANDTNDALKVEVTGITSETWRWVAAVDVVEVAYGT